MSDSRRAVIRLDDVSKVFQLDGLETHALASVSLDIQPGEFVSVTGPSGCGKSTLLNILGLLDSPTSGCYELDGIPVHDIKRAERARARRERIGFIFQNFNLIGELDVSENVALPLTYQRLGASEIREKVARALAMVGMDHRASHMPAQLSGGQQQRVAVARAVVTEPKLLLADEPTGNLDSSNGEQVMGLLHDLHTDGATICMVTHDPRYTGAASRTVSLFDGRIVPS